MQQLSGLDASFLYMETANAPMHVAGLAIYDPSTAPGGSLSYSKLIEGIERRLHLARTFRERLVRVPFDLDHPYWIQDPDFDLEYHVRHMALPRPGGWPQLMKLVGRLMSRPLDIERPLWELNLIENLGIDTLPEGAIAIFSKVHHAAIDGVSGVEITAALHDLAPDPPQLEPAEWKPDRRPSDLELMARSYGNAVLQPFKLAEVITRSMASATRVGRGFQLRELRPPPAPFSAPRTRFNRPVSPHRVVDGRSFDLGRIKAIKESLHGATVNDVVLAICSGALRSYLSEKGELPKRSLIAMAPISVRERNEKKALGNRVAAMLVDLGTDVDKPTERLLRIHDSASHSKGYTNAVGAKLMTDYSQFIPSATAGLAARLYSRMQVARAHRPVFNLVITNVPGPQVPLYSAGARLLDQFGAGPIFDGMGLIMPVYSYCGRLTISVTSCREMLPDPGRLADLLVESFESIEETMLGKSSDVSRGDADEEASGRAPRSKAKKKSIRKKSAKKKSAKKKTSGTRKKAARKANGKVSATRQ